jgi:hypothetical protein
MELVVFIEGYAHQNDWKHSEELLRQADKLNPELSTVYCHLIQRLPVDPQPSDDQHHFMADLHCAAHDQ